MKRFYFFLVLLFAVTNANSQLLTENFSYTAGQTLTANGWTAHSGAGTNSITVTAPGLTYTDHPGSGVGNAVTMTTTGEDVNKAFTSTNSGSVYVSFLVNLSAAQTGDYFAGLFQSSSIFPVRIYAKTDGAGGYFFGASKGNSAAVYETTPRVFGTTYLFVAKYTFNSGSTTDDQIDVWINPALGGTETTPTIAAITGASTDATSISAFYLRQGSTASAATPQVDAILVGTNWAQVTPGAAVPGITTTTLSAFGNVCINTTAGPQSFTINGTNLSTANVTVGALSGFSYSTTSGGTYSSSLDLVQSGGTFSQEVFVKFDPVAVQSYNGNIVINGGGISAPINVVASGAGINTAPTVTSGAASAITTTGATVAGNVSSIGCSALTAYGIEYSTTAGFANGTGTAAASSNISGGDFSADLSGLTPSTTYYYHAYATNGAGTVYGAEQSFTTATPVPVLSAGTLTAFGNICINTSAGPNSFTITGSNLTTADVTVAALAGFSYSTTSGGTYTSTLTLTQPGGSFSQEVFVKFDPTAVQSYSGDIAVGGGGASAINVAASGAGVNTAPSVTSGAASSITMTSATVAGTVTDNGCTAVTAYGIEYSTTQGFANGTGTAVAASNISGGNFSSDLTGLASGVTYYYHAYATNTGGTSYGAEQSFTTSTTSPLITVTPLTAFGDVCINTTAGPNSFTITGTNLTAADITVAALSGFTYSSTAGGTYSSTLTFTQPGGSFSQEVFVQFTPTAVQSYNGNISVTGGGAAAVNTTASGAGINTAPTVTSGSASAISSTGATVAGTVSATGCTAVTAYGIEYSTTAGFANGTGTPVASGNISGGDFSSALTGLTPATTYYYHAYATNGGGTVYGAEQSFVTLTPGISTTALASFGNICINTNAGPNSFTITGTNLTNANVTVGPLSGYSFSGTAGGPYSATLTLTQPGGAYSQEVFVQFSPVAVQSYDGNIPVSGGGVASAIQVAASGSGVNSPASVTTGGASGINYNSATLAGSITANGCSAITAYGVEYSTTAGFANGTGTQVAASNLSGGSFTAALSGLNPTTVYYYKAWATNAGGTSYGAQQTFTTAAVPIALSATSLTAFGPVCVNTTTAANSFTINGAFLTTANINVGPLNGYSFSTTAGGTYSASLSLTQPGGTYSQQIFVKFSPTAVQAYNGNIPVAGGGFATTVNVAASGSGVNTPATVNTGASSNITTYSATVAGQVVTEGCSAVTTYGIELSTISGFTNGTGTPYPATGITGGNYTVSLSGLVQGSTYYYKAYAVSGGVTAWGPQQSFTVQSIGNGFRLFPNPVEKGGSMRITVNNVKPGYYGLKLLNSKGESVYQWNMNIQSTFINQTFPVPATLPVGIYRAYLFNGDKEMGVITVLVL